MLRLGNCGGVAGDGNGWCDCKQEGDYAGVSGDGKDAVWVLLVRLGD